MIELKSGRKMLTRVFVRAAVFIILFAPPGDNHSTAQAADEHGEKHKHIVGVFTGVTNDTHDETNYTLGVEYEYKASDQLGVGVVYEHTPEAHDQEGVSVYLAALYIHPYAGFRIGVGLGEEKIHGSHGSKEDLRRISLAYDFHVGEFGIAPAVSIDRIDGENAEVYGVVFSKGFLTLLQLKGHNRKALNEALPARNLTRRLCEVRAFAGTTAWVIVTVFPVFRKPGQVWRCLLDPGRRVSLP